MRVPKRSRISRSIGTLCKRRRCLIPADAFYEWQRINEKTKRPFAFGMQSGEPYAFAGLWERWKPKEGDPLETFTILTTDPNELAEPVHNRMPVILEPRDYTRWMEVGDPARPPIDLLRPYPAEKMRSWAVDERVGNVRNDDAELLTERRRSPFNGNCSECLPTVLPDGQCGDSA